MGKICNMEEFPLTRNNDYYNIHFYISGNWPESSGDPKVVSHRCWETIDAQCLAHSSKPEDENASTPGWKVVRLFVSSTFNDYHNEREILVKKVGVNFNYSHASGKCKQKHAWGT